MSQMQNDLKQLQNQIKQIKVFCEAVADAHGQAGQLRDILHKNMNELIYRKSQPWFKDLDDLKVSMIKSMLQIDERIKKLEEVKRHP
jgi:hypothetical protein